jgi:hypothetical protein
VSFLHNALSHDPLARNDPSAKVIDRFAYSRLKGKEPPPAPGVPNPNDAMNAAQQQQDAMRLRRGMLANIYAGSLNQQPVSGKVQLGS